MSTGDIQIIGQPVFWIRMDAPTVDVLIKLAETHYDGKCKEAARLGGFLWGWRNSVHFDPNFPVMATWDNLDTSMKICESVSYLQDPEAPKLIAEYRARVTKAILTARSICQTWKVTI